MYDVVPVCHQRRIHAIFPVRDVKVCPKHAICSYTILPSHRQAVGATSFQPLNAVEPRLGRVWVGSSMLADAPVEQLVP